MDNVIDVLRERGFIEAVTSEEVREHLLSSRKVYCGFDPTADSLHLGNLVAIMGLAWFKRFGHTPVAIIGGATGMIGDPSGKSHERPLLDEASITRNLEGIKKNIEHVLSQGEGKEAVYLNNYEWFKSFSVLDFLREIGKQFRMGPMLAKESVRSRLESEEGMSYTEFSYQLLQSYDFAYLHETYGVTLQLGGSDQWGNITAGIDLAKKRSGGALFGMTFPLLTRSDGKKFGKSEKGAIWLSSEKLSPYEFYQYLYRMPDADVLKMLCMLTFLPLEEIRAIEQAMQEPGYEPNSAQKRLAEEVTRLIHGEAGLEMALRVTASLAPGHEAKLTRAVLEAAAEEMGAKEADRASVLGKKLVDILVELQLQASKGDVRRLIKGGGLYLNNQKVVDEQKAIEESDLVDNELVLFAFGKKNKVLLKLC